MINGLGVLGWGVGGIEAEAAMLGEAVSMLVPQVVGFRLTGELPKRDRYRPRPHGDGDPPPDRRGREVRRVFRTRHRDAAGGRSRDDREHVARIRRDLRILPCRRADPRLSAADRPSAERIALVEAYCKENLLWHDPTEQPTYSEVVELDLGDVEPSLAGPRRPQDRVPLRDAKPSFLSQLESFGVAYEGQDEAVAETFPASDPTFGQAPGAEEPRAAPSPVAVAEPQRHRVAVRGTDYEIEHGSVVIAAITSCTNTSNPQVMVGAGLLAKKAVEKGLTRKPWVKSSLAPGSKVVTEYYDRAGLTGPLEELGFHRRLRLHDMHRELRPAARADLGGGCRGDLVVCSVLSGNRNFEARIHSEVKANYLASPPLVVAYAIAGRLDVDLTTEPLGEDADGNEVFLQDVWPSPEEIQEVITESVRSEMFERTYADVFTGDENWRALPDPEAGQFAWDPDSTYVRRPPYFDGMSPQPGTVEDIAGARCLVMIGDSVTTDHISPAGAIKPDSPAGKYLIERGVERRAFNSYGSRRGNHEVMVRGTFANVRLRNLLVPGSEGTWTVHLRAGTR